MKQGMGMRLSEQPRNGHRESANCRAYTICGFGDGAGAAISWPPKESTLRPRLASNPILNLRSSISITSHWMTKLNNESAAIGFPPFEKTTLLTALRAVLVLDIERLP